MGLTRANIVNFAEMIAGTTGNTSHMNIAYAEVMQHLARSPNPPFVQSSNFTISSGTNTYTWSTNAVRLLGVFAEGKQLMPVTERELENYLLGWRDYTGTDLGTDEIHVYHTGENDLRTVRLFPQTSTGATGTWLHSITPITDVPAYFCLYIAFAVLERVFSYPDARQDKEFAALCGQIALVFARLIGY